MLEWVEPPKPLVFKGGDIVRCIDVIGLEGKLVFNGIYRVTEDMNPAERYFYLCTDMGKFYTRRFELVKSAVNAPPLIE